jgi:signal peptidase I
VKIDFALILTVLTLSLGLVWLADKLVLARRREAAHGKDAPLPWLVDQAYALFPILAVILCLRSFIYEPFRIPSSSMMPTLLIGDFIVVNKFAYGVRLPVLNTLVLETGTPERGDVAVFRYPGRQPPLPTDAPIGTDFIKRVIGLPGDVIRVEANRVSVNGQPVGYTPGEIYVGEGPGAGMTGSRLYTEALGGGHDHLILADHPLRAPMGNGEWTVPAGHYFVMGDNRDESDDSRFWGFVPESALSGRADAIWLNCANWFCTDSFDWRRIGDTIR